MPRKPRLSRSMTEEQFDNGYWYADELKAFARDLGVPRSSALRKDQIERVVKAFLKTSAIESPDRAPARRGVKDVDLGLRPDLPVVHYTSNTVTKAFIVREARKLDPDFRRKSGTRYLLNRWREEQIARGRTITYGDLVQQALTLNQEKTGPLRLTHGRYMNFISDFMAANPGAAHRQAVAAWTEVKDADAPKTYEAWARLRARPRRKR